MVGVAMDLTRRGREMEDIERWKEVPTEMAAGTIRTQVERERLKIAFA